MRPPALAALLLARAAGRLGFGDEGVELVLHDVVLVDHEEAAVEVRRVAARPGPWWLPEQELVRELADAALGVHVVGVVESARAWVVTEELRVLARRR